ncbi:MAG: carbonic anhydrase [Microbacteriaceae bacterium]
MSPAEAWAQLQRGNERFITGGAQHPRQDADRRAELAHTQHPFAAVFCCSDSRLAVEIIFDLGIGDAFVIRNAGQVATSSAIGSIEYAVGILAVPVLIVLSHDECGAVHAAIQSQRPDAAALPPHIADLIAPIIPAVRSAAKVHEGGTVDVDLIDPAEAGREHMRNTIAQLLEQSEMISAAVAAGTLAIVGGNYRLQEGKVAADVTVGVL